MLNDKLFFFWATSLVNPPHWCYKYMSQFCVKSDLQNSNNKNVYCLLIVKVIYKCPSGSTECYLGSGASEMVITYNFFPVHSSHWCKPQSVIQFFPEYILCRNISFTILFSKLKFSYLSLFKRKKNTYQNLTSLQFTGTKKILKRFSKRRDLTQKIFFAAFFYRQAFKVLIFNFFFFVKIQLS